MRTPAARGASTTQIDPTQSARRDPPKRPAHHNATTIGCAAHQGAPRTAALVHPETRSMPRMSLHLNSTRRVRPDRPARVLLRGHCGARQHRCGPLHSHAATGRAGFLHSGPVGPPTRAALTPRRERSACCRSGCPLRTRCPTRRAPASRSRREAAASKCCAGSRPTRARLGARSAPARCANGGLTARCNRAPAGRR